VAGGHKKVICLEMAEHVGVRHFSKFLGQVYEMLDDDGVFFLQMAVCASRGSTKISFGVFS
jgi:cyclopropane fatty-acyl-phospholipid synthase-like methyltransferase